MTKVWLDWTGVWSNDVALLKTAKEALADAIFELQQITKSEDRARRVQPEEGSTPAQRSLDFQQQDDKEKDYVAAYCPKCTIMIKKGTPSEVAPFQGQLCDPCKQAHIQQQPQTLTPGASAKVQIWVPFGVDPQVITDILGHSNWEYGR